MLAPPESAPDYKAQMEKFKKDSSSWGTDHTVVDMMKSPLNQPSAAGPSLATAAVKKP